MHMIRFYVFWVLAPSWGFLFACPCRESVLWGPTGPGSQKGGVQSQLPEHSSLIWQRQPQEL